MTKSLAQISLEMIAAGKPVPTGMAQLAEAETQAAHRNGYLSSTEAEAILSQLRPFARTPGRHPVVDELNTCKA